MNIIVIPLDGARSPLPDRIFIDGEGNTVFTFETVTEPNPLKLPPIVVAIVHDSEDQAREQIEEQAQNAMNPYAQIFQALGEKLVFKCRLLNSMSREAFKRTYQVQPCPCGCQPR